MSIFESRTKKITDVDDIIALFGRDDGITDVYLSTNKVPSVRRLNKIERAEEYDVIRQGPLEGLINSLGAQRGEMAGLRGEKLEEKDRRSSDNFAFDTGPHGRLRVNVSPTQTGKDKLMCLRRIPSAIPRPETLGLPEALVNLALLGTRRSGLILVGGETGTGKSTTLASVLQEINETNSGHIVTVEDPIEFILEDDGCLVSQRELHSAVGTWAEGAQNTLRQKADYVMIGEIQDRDTALAVLRASESGHTVFSTLHTSSGVKMIERLLSFFADDERTQMRTVLANNLLLLVGQKLVPNLQGGLTLAVEVVPGSPTILAAIREDQDSAKLRNSLIAAGEVNGAQTLDSHLAELVARRVIDVGVAQGYANDAEALRVKLSSVRANAGGRGF